VSHQGFQGKSFSNVDVNKTNDELTRWG